MTSNASKGKKRPTRDKQGHGHAGISLACKIRQAFGHWRVQIPLYLFPHALLFLSWFFFLSAVPFFLLTRACTWGRPLGAAAPESPPPEPQPLSPRFPFGRILAQLFDFLNLQRGTKNHDGLASLQKAKNQQNQWPKVASGAIF